MKMNLALVRVRTFLASLLIDRRGASGIEYAIVAAVVLGAVVAAVGGLTGPIASRFQQAASAIAGGGS